MKAYSNICFTLPFGVRRINKNEEKLGLAGINTSGRDFSDFLVDEEQRFSWPKLYFDPRGNVFTKSDSREAEDNQTGSSGRGQLYPTG